MANSAGGARALERSLGRAGGVRAQPSSSRILHIERDSLVPPFNGLTTRTYSGEEGCARTPLGAAQGPFQSTGAPRGVGHGCP